MLQTSFSECKELYKWLFIIIADWCQCYIIFSSYLVILISTLNFSKWSNKVNKLLSKDLWSRSVLFASFCKPFLIFKCQLLSLLNLSRLCFPGIFISCFDRKSLCELLFESQLRSFCRSVFHCFQLKNLPQWSFEYKMYTLVVVMRDK